VTQARIPKLRNAGEGVYEVVGTDYIVVRDRWDSVNIWLLMLDGVEVLNRTTRRELLEALVNGDDGGDS